MSAFRSLLLAIGSTVVFGAATAVTIAFARPPVTWPSFSNLPTWFVTPPNPWLTIAAALGALSAVASLFEVFRRQSATPENIRADGRRTREGIEHVSRQVQAEGSSSNAAHSLTHKLISGDLTERAVEAAVAGLINYEEITHLTEQLHKVSNRQVWRDIVVLKKTEAEGDPTNPDLQARLADVYLFAVRASLDVNDFHEAQKNLIGAIDIQNSLEVSYPEGRRIISVSLITLAYVQERIGDIDKAVASLEGALSILETLILKGRPFDFSPYLDGGKIWPHDPFLRLCEIGRFVRGLRTDTDANNWKSVFQAARDLVGEYVLYDDKSKVHVTKLKKEVRISLDLLRMVHTDSK